MRSVGERCGLMAVALSMALAFGAGCAPPRAANDFGGPIPGWAMHIGAPVAVKPVTNPELVKTLINELGRPVLEPGVAYVAPEQIVAMAIAELKQDNIWDAALLLNIATYRYYQQAKLAQHLSQLDAQDSRKNAAFVYRLQASEQQSLGDNDMMAELAALRARLRTLGVVATAGAEAASQAQASGSLADAPTPSIPAAAVPSVDSPGAGARPATQRLNERDQLGSVEERLTHVDLAEAFLARLLTEAPKGGFRIRLILETTPLTTFRRAALAGMNEYHPAWFVPDTTPQMVALSDDYIEALRSPRPATRSSAAFVLGATKHVSAGDALRGALVGERDPRVRLTLEYALLRLGDELQLAALQQGALSKRGRDSAHAFGLLRALARQLYERMDAEPATRVVLDRQWPPEARRAAARLLGDLGAMRPLPAASVAALLETCIDANVALAESACASVADLEQLNHEQVKQLLVQSPRENPGLLRRWAKVAEAADLPSLDSAFESARKAPKRTNDLAALTSAVSRIPGGAATEVLANWLVRVEDPQIASYIAYKWSKRPDVTAAARKSLLSRVGGSRRLYLRLASGDPGARDEAQPLLNQKDVPAIYWAALLAGLRHVPSQPAAPLLWELASFHDPRVYPAEVIVRNGAITSLFYSELRVRYPLAEAEGD